jgi:hypothetical protein
MHRISLSSSKRLRTAWLPFFGVIAFACASASTSNPKPVPYTTVYQSIQGYVGDAVKETVRDSTRWRAIWSSLTRQVGPQPPLPQVDFTRSMLIVVKREAGSGDSLQITHVSQVDHSLRVVYTISYQCSPANAVRMPVHIVQLAASDADATFEEKEVFGPNCPPPSAQ